MKIPATKNGNSGSLKRTSEPKFATVSPTEKAKNIENNMQNKSIGFFLINEKNPRNFNLIRRNTVSANK